MELKSQGKFICTRPIEKLLTQGEKYSDEINIYVDPVNNGVDVSGCTFVLRTVAPSGAMTETLLDKSISTEPATDGMIHLTWRINEYVTAEAGLLQLELIGTLDAAAIIKYKMPSIYVKAAVQGDEEHTPTPDILDQKLAEMNELLEEAKSASIQEVVDARTGCLSEPPYTYDSLDQRLDAEMGMCVQHSEMEMELSALTQAYQTADADLQAQIDQLGAADVAALKTEIEAARTGKIVENTFTTLSSRLNADFELCVTQGELENALSNVTAAYNARIDAVEAAVGAAAQELAAVVDLPESEVTTE